MKIVALLLAMAAGLAFAAEAPPPPPGSELTPPRLSFVDGSASFWRPGADDWSPARVNTPLAPGDALYASERANLEVQIGPRAFLRAAERTQIGLVNLEPDFLQVKVTAGQASIDLRSLPAAYTVELDTPNAVFTIEHTGYYRVIVGEEVTQFITRRGGRATVTVGDGAPQAIAPSEQIVVRGAAAPTVETYVAPELDAWDRWNYARTDYEIEALSARYVSPGIYGVGALDYWGSWRVVPTYGAVWVPDRIAVGWAPYTTGSWIWDPFYGWTWVDDAPWGWAPFHYGRWVFINSYWAWTPGPVIVRPAYAPALVVFFGVAPSVSVRINVAGPALGWVALGWGEPLHPWWGPPGFIGSPWWGGWGGPRTAGPIAHQHIWTPRAASAISVALFGSGPVRPSRFTPAGPHDLERVAIAPAVRPRPVSLAPSNKPALRPPAQIASRPVIATRPPREAPLPFQREAPPKPSVRAPAPPRIIPAPAKPAAVPARPSFGETGTERARPAQPPRLADVRRAPPAPAAPPRAARALPGKPANLSPPPARRPAGEKKK